MADALAINSRANIITYCNSGQFASTSWFVFHELMGNPNVRLYDGSMHQWALEKRPVEKIKRPFQ
jgi:thiosulfate/3-mercaptopyruvate sulfurtransferase